MSHICHIDESGDLHGLQSPWRLAKGQPVLVVLGLIVPEESLTQVTSRFLEIRGKFGPGRAEVKGAELRGDLAKPSDENSRHAGLLALKAALELLENADARVTARVCVKPAGEPFDGDDAHDRALRFIAGNFSRFLRAEKSEGRVVCDSRGPFDSDNNMRAARALRRPFGFRRPEFPPPVFAHSEDCVGLQLADWLCSALVAPVAATAYCGDCERLRESVHVNGNYLRFRDRHGGGEWLWRRQLRFAARGGRMRMGLEVDDPRGRSSELLFRASAGS